MANLHSTAFGQGKRDYFVHPLALCESANIGAGTRIWAFAHIMSGADVGAECNVGDHAFIESGALLGNRVTVKNRVMIWEGVTIEDDVFIGPGVTFTNDLYPRSPRMQGETVVADRYKDKSKWLVPTRVFQGASIGAGAVILPGVTIGAYALVAAGAVVSTDVEPHQLVIGSPARPRGWVCRCGMRLNKKGRKWVCPVCGKSFSAQQSQLKED